MADIKSPEERSKNMAKIRSRDTKPEEYIRKKLFSLGYRYRKNANTVVGHPDIWLAKYNTAVFVNGCFWHRHQGCKYAYTPKSRGEFWEEKFQKNIERDSVVRKELTSKGIKQLIIWECAVNKMMRSRKLEQEAMYAIIQFLSNDFLFLEI